MKEDYKQILQEIEEEKEKTNLLQELAKNVESISNFHKEESVTIEEFKKMGVEVFSVSCDTHFVHKAWADASDSIKKIKYTMLADPLAVLAKGFGVYKEDEGLAYRGTFLVDPEGKIKWAEIQDNSIGRNADELVRKVKAAQFVASHPGEVCPAKWKEGSETLKPSIDLVGKI